MHRTDKADLQNGLIKKVPECVVSDPPLGVVCVLDGGSISAYPGLSPSHLSISVISSLFIVILKTRYNVQILLHWNDFSNGKICGFERCISDVHVAK